jgi:hypothetical protein
MSDHLKASMEGWNLATWEECGHGYQVTDGCPTCRIKALEAFRDEVMGLVDEWVHITDWRITEVYDKHFPKEQSGHE